MEAWHDPTQLFLFWPFSPSDILSQITARICMMTVHQSAIASPSSHLECGQGLERSHEWQRATEWSPVVEAIAGLTMVV